MSKIKTRNLRNNNNTILIIGILSLLIPLIVLLFIPCPTKILQYLLIGFISLGIASFASFIPGINKLKVHFGEIGVVGVGATGMMIILMYKPSILIDRIDRCVEPFSIRVYINLLRASGDLVLRNEGKIILLLDEYPLTTSIDENGTGVFNGINTKYLSKPVKLHLEHPTFKVKYPDSTYFLKPNQQVQLDVVTKDLDFLRGRVFDQETLQPIDFARVSIKTFETHTDHNGFFALHIPLEHQSLKQHVSIQKVGYKPFYELTVIDSEEIVPFPINKQ